VPFAGSGQSPDGGCRERVTPARESKEAVPRGILGFAALDINTPNMLCDIKYRIPLAADSCLPGTFRLPAMDVVNTEIPV